MKTKLIIALTAILLAASSLSFAKEAAETKPATTSSETSNGKDVAIIDDEIKTFDFQRIFREANAYYKAASEWTKLKCTPKSAFVCTKRECPKLKVRNDVYMILDRKNNTVALCQGKICEYLLAKYDQTGVFVAAQIRESLGMYIRVLGNNRYKEISMVGLDAYITNGVCENI